MVVYTPYYPAWHNQSEATDTPIDKLALKHFDDAFAEVYTLISALGGGGTGMYGANNLSEVVDDATARANIGVARAATPEQYGTVGVGSNDTAVFQTAVDTLSAAGGGTLQVRAGTYIIGGLVMKQGVYIKGVGAWKQASTTGTAAPQTVFAAPSGYAGWIVDSTAATASSYGIEGVSIVGVLPTSGASALQGGIFIRDGRWCSVVGCSVWGTSLGGIKVNGIAILVRDCVSQNYYQYRAASSSPITTNEGSVWIQGTDHLVINNQCNGGKATGDAPYDATNFRACGLLLECWTTTVVGGNGEFADCGIKIPSGMKLNKLYDMRGDVNAGHGIIIDGFDNTIHGCKVFGDSGAADGTYDGVFMSAGSWGNKIFGLSVGSTAVSPNRVRYGYNDQSLIFATADTWYAPNEVRGYTYDVLGIKVDMFEWAAGFPGRSVEAQGATADKLRPPARYSPGLTWRSTTDGWVGSDGAKWMKLSDDSRVGNRLSPEASIPRATTPWLAFTSGRTTMSVVSGSAKFKRFQCNRMTATATGITAKSIDSGTTASLYPLEPGAASVGVYAAALQTGGNLTLTAYCYDVSNALIGGAGIAVTGAAAIAVGTTQTKVTGTFTAPAGTVNARFVLTYAHPSMASGNGDVCEFAKAWMGMGTITDFVNP